MQFENTPYITLPENSRRSLGGACKFGEAVCNVCPAMSAYVLQVLFYGPYNFFEAPPDSLSGFTVLALQRIERRIE